MKLPYFAKYLPVEGEITDPGIAYKSKKCPQLEAKFSTAPWNKKVMDFYDIEKVKLFLCSRDIQVGDKVKVDVLENGVFNDFTFVREDSEEVQSWIFQGVGTYVHYPETDDISNIIKVVGEISPEAIWVKEGDEFDEDEVDIVEQLLIIRGGNVATNEFVQNQVLPKRWFGGISDWWVDEFKEASTLVKIKGPCGHFH